MGVLDGEVGMDSPNFGVMSNHPTNYRIGRFRRFITLMLASLLDFMRPTSEYVRPAWCDIG